MQGSGLNIPQGLVQVKTGTRKLRVIMFKYKNNYKTQDFNKKSVGMYELCPDEITANTFENKSYWHERFFPQKHNARIN